MRRIAVTGATGFIGRHLVARLITRGDEVRAIVRPGSPALDRLPLPPGVVVIRAALNEASLGDAFRDADIVVHLAGVVSSVRDQTFQEVNVDGTRAVAAAARVADAHLVNISSLAAAGPASATAPRTEDDPPAPITAYGRSKLDGERAIASVSGLRWTVLRPAIVYGPGDRAFLPLFEAAARGLMPLVGRESATYSVIHVDDLVSAITAAVDRRPERDTIFVAHSQPASTRQLSESVRDAVGRQTITIQVPMSLTRLAAWAGDVAGALTGRPQVINSRRYTEMSAEGFVCRVDRMRDRLEIVAQIGLNEGMTGTAAWYREIGWL
ncbi:MAG TPA: NAD-dependent epimerase/dehydratase family protein [Vicinamibacterales bacterium]|jgi:nucleoside-diphosphate-sugar epimerase